MIVENAEQLIYLIAESYETSEKIKKIFIDFVANHPENYKSRENPDGHITGSMLVVNEDRTKVLLTHHKKFNKWLQLGGHLDIAHESCLQGAIREMKEEGFGNNEVSHELLLNGNPLDIDKHWVGDHTHYDICFVTIVKDENNIVISDESINLKWVEIKNMTSDLYDERLKRMVVKAQNIPNIIKKLKF